MVQQQHSLTDRTGTQTRGSGSVVAPSQSIQYGKEQLRWRKPRDSWWKCNVDASITHSSSSIGWCMRNCVGNFVAAGTISYPPHILILTVVEGEAMAILEAMREAISRGWINIVLAKLLIWSLTFILGLNQASYVLKVSIWSFMLSTFILVSSFRQNFV
jgi:hypothetical protein